MAAVTRLALYGGARMPYGSFAGKEVTASGGAGILNIRRRKRAYKFRITKWGK